MNDLLFFIFMPQNFFFFIKNVLTFLACLLFAAVSMDKNDRQAPALRNIYFFPLDISFFQSILHCNCLKNCQEG